MKQVRILSYRELDQLEYYYNNDEKDYFQERCHIILLSNAGYTTREITNELSIDLHTVYKWIDRYEAMGLGGLENKVGQGRNSFIDENLSPEQIEVLWKEVRKNPDYLSKVRKKLIKMFDIEFSTRVLRRYVRSYEE